MNKLQRILISASLAAALLSPLRAQEPAQTRIQTLPLLPSRSPSNAPSNSPCKTAKTSKPPNSRPRLADRSALDHQIPIPPECLRRLRRRLHLWHPRNSRRPRPRALQPHLHRANLNEPLRGQAKELQEQAKSQRILLEDARNTVISRTAAAYLELVMVRHSLDLLRKEQGSADKIARSHASSVEKENLELPVEVTRSQLTKARIMQRILQLEGRQDELEVFLRNQSGLTDNTPIEVSPEDLPGEAEQEGANLVALAMENNASLRLSRSSDVRAKEFRLIGEKRGYYPTLELVSIYSLLAKFNNYDQFFQTFERNNYNAGVQVQVPHLQRANQSQYRARRSNLDRQSQSRQQETEISAAVRQKTRHLRERDAAKEVARLELQLAQQDVAVLQSQFDEGKINLREVERARVTENEKWMAYLDANFQRQQAQLDLLQTAGQLDKVWQ